MNEVKHLDNLIWDFEVEDKEGKLIVCHPNFWYNLTRHLYQYTIVDPRNLNYRGLRVFRSVDVKEDEAIIS